jgi:tetratricopeptide (TPR) repeat protein
LRKDAIMTRSAFFVCVCMAAAVVLGSLAAAANPGGEMEPGIETALAVQKTLLVARDHVVRKEYKKAIDLLEANLTRANGDRHYLTTLRDAYRAYIRDLGLANQSNQAKLYQDRLKILEDEPAAQPTQKSNPPPVVKEEVGPIKTPGTGGYVVRGAMPDPFDSSNEIKQPAAGGQASAKSLLEKGEAEFSLKHYASAKKLYELASQADPATVGKDARGRWAYCQMALVAEQVNRFPEQPCDLTKLETDVKVAAEVAPNLARWGDEILDNIKQRRKAVPPELAKAPTERAAITVKHSERGANGFQLAETGHFRVFHNQNRDFADKVAQIAEDTRLQMSRKWFGKDGDDWQPKCDIYLHADGTEYKTATGQNPDFPGHSRIELDKTNGRVVCRTMHLRCDNPSLLQAILPHETTHVVLAGNFGSKHTPRWVDEGVAVLTEPEEKVEQHRKNLNRCLQNRELIPLKDLLALENFPEARQITVFYAQSVALVDYLTRLRGPQVFMDFAREGLRCGYESALQKHYGLQGIPDLQDQFTRRIVADMEAGAKAFAER